MKLVFYASDKPREQDLAANFLKGAARHGVKVEQRALCASPEIGKADAVAMVGVKSKRLFELTRAAGAVPIMLDKGYIRTRRPGARVWEFWRASVGAHHPTFTSLMAKKMPSDRLDALGIEWRPWRVRGFSIVVAGSSAKYHEFYGLPEPNIYYRDLVAELRERTKRPIIYRPKPSYRDAERIRGAEFSDGNENIVDALAGAWALVTHGSNACFEAALLGIPSIILGEGIAAPISSTSLDDLDRPKMGKRERWANNLAYHQWTESEMASGAAWETIGRQIDEYRFGADRRA
jgi:hypothetical protein